MSQLLIRDRGGRRSRSRRRTSSTTSTASSTIRYREKYALNLKREFPRIPFYDDFRQWVVWGKELMELHIGYETVEAWKLSRVDAEEGGDQPRPYDTRKSVAGEAGKDPTIREKFNTYRFADYKEKVIDLLARVTTVSVRTQAIVAAMRAAKRD